jgi:AraC-like DNA-binding protein
MKKAVELMGCINMKLYEIADKVGYDNPKNFSRAFRQFYNMTPREYRDQSASKNDEKTIFHEEITN